MVGREVVLSERAALRSSVVQYAPPSPAKAARRSDTPPSTRSAAPPGAERAWTWGSSPRSAAPPGAERAGRGGPPSLGRRLTKTFDGKTTEYTWDGDDLVHERVRDDATGALTAPLTTWVFEPDTFTPLAKIEGRKRYGIVGDHLGSPTTLTTEAGKIAWQAQLDLYGVPREETPVGPDAAAEEERTTNPWRFPGQYEDPETGLYYNRFRYYDPQIGRYISEDPIGLLGGLAQFGYVRDPLGGVDPFGLVLKPVDFAGSPELYNPGAGERNQVEIPMQGTRSRDFTQANREARLRSTPEGYTWHHVADFDPTTGRTTMQLVTTKAHESALPHFGSVSQFEKALGVKYDSREAVTAAANKGWLKNPQRPPRAAAGAPCT